MGAEIALVFALAGHDVVLSDRTDEQLAAAKNRLASVLDRGIPRGFFKEEDKDAGARPHPHDDRRSTISPSAIS